MASLTRGRSGAFKARKRIPEDVRADYQAMFGPGWEEKLTLPASTPEAEAKARYVAWLAPIQGRIAALRAAKSSKAPAALNQREADSLAGDWYRWFVDQHLDSPGQPGYWATLRALLLDDLTDWDPDTGERVWAPDAEVLEAVAKEARAAAFLIDRGQGPELSLKVGDGKNRKGGISWGCLTTPLLH